MLLEQLLCLTLLLMNKLKLLSTNCDCSVVFTVLSERKLLPLVDKLGHLFLHLFALQLLLQKDLEARHRGGALGVFLVGLRGMRTSFKNSSGPINNHSGEFME